MTFEQALLETPIDGRNTQMQIQPPSSLGRSKTSQHREITSAPSVVSVAQGLEPAPTAPSFTEILGILNYNQGLVEFADSKAGSLILLNSLLIAALGALPSTGNLGSLKLLSVILCSAAVYVCFQMISSKEKAPSDDRFSSRKRKIDNSWEENDFLFFACIGSHKSGDEFCQAFEKSNEVDRGRAVLQRTYIISQIASRKFSQYKTAQQITSVALVVWVVVNVVPFISL